AEPTPKADAPRTDTPAARNDRTEPAKGTDTPAKPLGFKPRFKAGGTPPANGDVPPPEKSATNNDITEPAKGTDTPAKPLGFKPRFKPSVSPETDTPKPTGTEVIVPKENTPEESNEKDQKQPDKPLGF